MTIFGKTAAALLVSTATIGISVAHAQAAPPADGSGAAPAGQSSKETLTPDQTDAIIVTAQKRPENVQNVPLAVQVVTSQQLATNGVRDFADLNRVAPSLVVRPAENPVNASVSIRGVGTFAFSIGVEPSVAVQVDDVTILFQARAFADLSDVQRIEVLRGPQSTLYGKSASAGLINIVTPAPSSTMTVKVSGLATTDDEFQGNLVVSGPLSDTLGFRSTVNYDNFRGNIRNLYNGDEINGRAIFSTRNKLVWKPNSRLTVDLGVDYIDGRNTTGRPFFAVNPNAHLRGNPAYPVSVWAPGITFGPDNRDVVNDYTTGTQYHDIAQSLRGSLDLGGPTLMSITSHDKFKLYDQLDQDESGIAAINNQQFGTFGSEQWTQEFRLISPSHDRLRYTLGLFYSDVDYSRDFTRGPYFSQARWYATAKSLLGAGFGQLEFDILPGTTLIAGGRYSFERVEFTFDDILHNTNFAGHDDSGFGTYKLGIEQHLTPNVMLFATYATGHKGETYDLSTGFNTNRTTPVRPETSKDVELGARTQFLDHRLTFNLTLFDTHYRDFQAQGIETLPDGSVNFRLANVGGLHSRGVEVETSARPTPGLTIGGSIAYLDSVITNFPLAQCYTNQTAAQGCVPAAGGIPAHQNLKGARPPQAPEWKLNANFDYALNLGDAPFQGVLAGAYMYQSRINYSLNQDPNTIQRGYGIANLSLGIRQPEHRYELMLFVNNLFNKHYFQNITNSSGNYAGLLALQSYLPRDFARYGGIRGSFSF